jgi:hypothetical protein
LAVGSVAALLAVAGCGASAADNVLDDGNTGAHAAAAVALAATTMRLPVGNIAATADPHPGLAISVRPIRIGVSGSMALVGVHRVPWLPALGPGVSLTAPLTVTPGTDSPADAAAGFYQAYYAQRYAAACGYVAPAQRPGCAELLGRSTVSYSLVSLALGFIVAKDAKALVTMTGAICQGAGRARQCATETSSHWVFNDGVLFDELWPLTARQTLNPLVMTPCSQVGGHWYVALP